MSDPNFLMDTYSIPDGVNPDIAAKRNQLVEDWRAGEIEDETLVLSGFARLAVLNEGIASDETITWLAESRKEFSQEAGVDPEEADQIWQSIEES